MVHVQEEDGGNHDLRVSIFLSSEVWNRATVSLGGGYNCNFD
jgi:hypothetical protein